MRKKTHEEYMAELAVKNPNVEVVEKYIDAKTKIKHHCLIHNIYWEISPTSVLQGTGCRLCGNEKLHNSKSKTHKQYIDELSIKSPNIEVVGEYKGTDISIKHYCKIHGIFWDARPANLLHGQNCPLCGRENQIKARRKTHEQYIQEVKNVNSNIKIIGKYINTTTPILHKCKVDGYEWMALPSGILGGAGCPKCANNIKRTHEEYIAKLKVLNPNIEVIEGYKNTNTSILHKCKIHNVEWKISPTNALKGHGCPICWRIRNGKSIRKTHQEYVEELKTINTNIEVIDEYIKINTPIKHRCKIDGYEWYTTPKSTIQGNGCPKCRQSHGERQIGQILDAHNIKYIAQKKFDDCYNIRALPFDFYLPEYNKCIEYDGEQHFKPKEFFGGEDSFQVRKKHDQIKNEYCKNNGISLLRIPYYKNVEEELNNFLFI